MRSQFLLNSPEHEGVEGHTQEKKSVLRLIPQPPSFSRSTNTLWSPEKEEKKKRRGTNGRRWQKFTENTSSLKGEKEKEAVLLSPLETKSRTTKSRKNMVSGGWWRIVKWDTKTHSDPFPFHFPATRVSGEEVEGVHVHPAAAAAEEQEDGVQPTA